MREPPTRRELFHLAGAAAVALVACDNGRPRRGLLGAMERWNERVQAALFSPSRELVVTGPLTPEDAFPNYHAPHTDTPVAPRGWKLKIGGRVARPMALTLDELVALPRTAYRIEHHCVEGWSAIADWQGVRLSELARHVGAADTDYVEFRSFEGYWSSWDRGSAMHPQTLIAYGMNGKPLGPDHGAPARLYGAVKLGYKNVKYLAEINFVDRETGGYWEDRGYEWFAGT
ncbi:MAG TPA: molybdopterin-dependent oxidoreductase [Kofleriaceae bacterium]|jgi:DMSO/TMAO reductase YedYZ molybdopterin-dependent catalytic subunit